MSGSNDNEEILMSGIDRYLGSDAKRKKRETKLKVDRQRLGSQVDIDTDINDCWEDPESPENLEKFIKDLESLGSHKIRDKSRKAWGPSRLMDELDNGRVSRKIVVSGNKKSWKNNLRREHMENLSGVDEDGKGGVDTDALVSRIMRDKVIHLMQK